MSKIYKMTMPWHLDFKHKYPLVVNDGDVWLSPYTRLTTYKIANFKERIDATPKEVRLYHTLKKLNNL